MRVLNSLSALVHAWNEAKAAEVAANNRRLEIEAQLIGVLPCDDPEGAVKAEADGFQVKVQYKVTRSVDSDKLQSIWSSLSPKAQAAFAWKASVKVRELRGVQEYLPAEYAQIATAIESKPAKPAITVTAIEKGAA